MSADTRLDATEAARLLATADRDASVSTSRDYRDWAVITACVGVAMGVFGATFRLSLFTFIPYCLVVIGVSVYAFLRKGTTPRGIFRLYGFGLGGTVALYMALIAVTSMNEKLAWAYSVAGGVVVALPCLVAAGMIWSRR